MAASDKSGHRECRGRTRQGAASGDADAMAKAMEALTAAQHKAAESMYRQAGPQSGAGGPATGSGGRDDGQRVGAVAADGVIDAEVVDEERSRIMDFYAILGVTREATLEDVKRAYRRLARRFHPDINPGDELAAVRFREIALAYETLIDPDSRRRYDLVGHRAEPPAAPGSGSKGLISRPACTRTCSPRSATCSPTSSRGERAHTAGGAGRGADLHQTVTLSFEAALRGGEHGSSSRVRRRCAMCSGTGALVAWNHGACTVPGERRVANGARTHGVLPHVPTCRRQRRPAPAAVRRVRGDRADGPDRVRSGRVPAGVVGRRADSRARDGARRTSGRCVGRSVHHGAGESAPTLPSRGRRSARPAAASRFTKRRSGARVESRRSTAAPASRAARHAVGTAVPSARPRRPVARDGRQGDLVVEVR